MELFHPNLHARRYMSLYVGDCLVCRFGSNCSIKTCIPDGHLHTVTYTRCHIDKIHSPDNEHRGARNMYRSEINIYEKELCFKLVIYKDYTELHGQQNIKFWSDLDPPASGQRWSYQLSTIQHGTTSLRL